MAHANFIEDTQGDIIDVRYYCSDWCSRFDTDIYNGWSGCYTLTEPTTCHTCQSPLDYYDID